MTLTVSTEAPARVRGTDVHHRDARSAGQTPVADARRGPLLAICGLSGGAGTTTLAYLVALAAARDRAEPVLVADTGGPTGGLAELAGVQAPRSLLELACHLAAALPPRDGLYIPGPAGLGVLASGPEFSTTCPREQLRRLLADARDAHGLTVIDCGTLARDVDQAVAAAATHIAWVMPATTHAASRAPRVLAAAPTGSAREILVARAEVRQAKAPVRELRQIATERQAPLVLVPHLAGLEDGRLDQAVQTAQVPLHAILGALTR